MSTSSWTSEQAGREHWKNIPEHLNICGDLMPGHINRVLLYIDYLIINHKKEVINEKYHI